MGAGMKGVAAACALLALLVASPSDAGSVYLNGVNFDGVSNQEFKNCTVKFDSEGNIWITAKEYIVKVESKEGVKQSEPREPVKIDSITKKYYLVSESGKGGRSGYDVDVFINGAHVRRVLNSEEQVVMDLTPLLWPGRNTVKLAATKAKGTAHVPGSKHHTTVFIGEGSEGGNSIVLDRPIIEFKRTEAESEPYVADYTLTAK
jgi:hypothetical protein